VRIAVIDIGTNTLLLLVVEKRDGKLEPVVDLCRFGRLGKGLDATGSLAPDAIAKSLEICREYRKVMDELGVDAPRVIATQAMREANNAVDFVPKAEAILRAKIEVIAGSREAELAKTAVARTFPDLAETPYVVVDVGGGSTEFITPSSAVSIPIGAVRLTERHLKTDPPTAAEIAALDADIANHLATLELPAGVPLVATAGTATTIAAIKLGLIHYDAEAVTGLRIAPDALDALLARLYAATVAERRAIPGMESERADVIAAGVAIYARVVARMHAPVMITCDRGIRWGVAYETVG
jgi:exopolyphosphatase/guanosine-5'-triphosphate,3'-diphosphate pyrophosphatase